MKHEINGLNRAIIIISKIIEVFGWVGTAIFTAMTGVTAFGHQELLKYLSTMDGTEKELSILGFTSNVTNTAGELSTGACIVCFIAGIIGCALMAMIFRNVYLIFKTTEGMTSFSEGKTPFQKDNIRMVREIGIFSIAMPIVQLILSVVIGLLIGFEHAETNVELTGVFFGLVMLALSRYFAYGMQLQNEVDGLV